MAMDATLQVRMDSELKTNVEELYRSMGTSFAEAVRIFARQSLLAGGMPFRPARKTWEEMTEEELAHIIQASDEAIEKGLVHTQDDVDARMNDLLAHG